jgi:hypothetical protein
VQEGVESIERSDQPTHLLRIVVGQDQRSRSGSHRSSRLTILSDRGFPDDLEIGPEIVMRHGDLAAMRSDSVSRSGDGAPA